MVLLFRAFAFRYVDVCSDHLKKFSVPGGRWVAGRIDVFDGPIGEYDSELECALPILAQRLKSLFAYHVAVVWMDPLQYGFEVGKTSPRIKIPDSVTFFRPVDRPYLIKDDRARVAQPLCFGQVRFASAQSFFACAELILCPLTLSDVARHAQIPTAALLKLVNANLHWEGGAVLAPVAGLERNGFTGDGALLQALDRRIVETNVETAFVFADHFFPAVVPTIAGLPVNVENGPVVVKQKEGVSRVIHESAETGLARAQLL